MLAYFKKAVLITCLFSSLALPVFAVPAWKIEPAASKITFIATQNGAPVIGEFKSFSGNIVFDRADLASSAVMIKIDMASVSASYNQIVDTLKSVDWFDTAAFPSAVFKTNHFTKVGDNKYTADGTLTIREKTAPITLTFTLEKYTDADALVKGSATLKRTALGVGRGDWAKTDSIKDDVQVDFVLAAKK